MAGEHVFSKKKPITVEIRSLNSKFTDIRFKLPQNYKDRESYIRKKVLAKAERGKLELAIDIKISGGRRGLCIK